MLTTVFTKRYTEGSALIFSVVYFQDQDSNVLFQQYSSSRDKELLYS